MTASKHHFDHKGKAAERFVHKLAEKSFLTDWCFLNPRLPNGRELCDLLVVFDQTAIIWQVKDLKRRKKGDLKEADKQKNLRQLSGARRQLFDLGVPIQLENPRRTVQTFDPGSMTEVFLISALLGEVDDFFDPMPSVNDYHVHVFPRDFVEIVLQELDTIADFTIYLRAKEAFIANKPFSVFMGGEEELLARYLVNDRSFESIDHADIVCFAEGSWEEFRQSPVYQSKKRADETSYEWDEIINRAHEGSKRYELVARELARPNRFQRRFLAKRFLDGQMTADCDKIHDIYRTVLLMEDATYCFLFFDESLPRGARLSCLKELCFVARGSYPQNTKVVGIATEKRIGPTRSYDFALLNPPVWTSENQKEAERLKQRLGMFENPRVQNIQEAEYPE